MQKKNHGNTESLTARMAGLLSVPESAFPTVPYLELHGDSTLAVAGYETLVSYDDRRICFRMRKGFCGVRTLCIEGENLCLSALRQGCLSVRGRIDAVRIGHDGEVEP